MGVTNLLKVVTKQCGGGSQGSLNIHQRTLVEDSTTPDTCCCSIKLSVLIITRGMIHNRIDFVPLPDAFSCCIILICFQVLVEFLSPYVPIRVYCDHPLPPVWCMLPWFSLIPYCNNNDLKLFPFLHSFISNRVDLFRRHLESHLFQSVATTPSGQPSASDSFIF